MQFHNYNGKLTSKLKRRIDAIMQQKNQDKCFTEIQKVKVNLCLPEYIAKKIVLWEFHVNNSTEIRYDIISGRYILTVLGFNLKFMTTSLQEVM